MRQRVEIAITLISRINSLTERYEVAMHQRAYVSTKSETSPMNYDSIFDATIRGDVSFTVITSVIT